MSRVLRQNLWPLEERNLVEGQRWASTTWSFLCSQILLKYKRDSESFWHRHQKRTEKSALLLVFQFSSVAQLCPILCDSMDWSMLGFPVHHQHPEFTQTHVHWVGHAIQPSHPLLSPSPPAFNLPQHQDLSQWVSSSHQVAKVLEFQLQH